MAIPWDVQRQSRYAGIFCEHHLLLQVTRPAYPNADGGAEDAAHAGSCSVAAASLPRTSW